MSSGGRDHQLTWELDPGSQGPLSPSLSWECAFHRLFPCFWRLLPQIRCCSDHLFAIIPDCTHWRLLRKLSSFPRPACRPTGLWPRMEVPLLVKPTTAQCGGAGSFLAPSSPSVYGARFWLHPGSARDLNPHSGQMLSISPIPPWTLLWALRVWCWAVPLSGHCSHAPSSMCVMHWDRMLWRHSLHFPQVHDTFTFFECVFFYVMKMCNEKMKIDVHSNTWRKYMDIQSWIMYAGSRNTFKISILIWFTLHIMLLLWPWKHFLNKAFLLHVHTHV